VLDVDEFFRCMALEGIVNQWDGYGYTRFGPNNFRIYHDPSTGRFSFIPWGMDMALKPLNDEPDLDVLAPTGMLLQRCFAGEACRARYLATVRDMADLVAGLDLAAQADAMYAQVAEHVAADPRKEIDDATFEAVFAAVREWLTHRGADVRAALP
jgi:spore coat protein CotH